MKERIKQLTLSVQATVILLLTAATLIVVGIFNATLKWDIFGPKVEAVLYGVFFSSIALSVIGVAMTIVLGIREVVHSFQLMEKSSSGSKEDIREVSKRTYTWHLLWSLVVLLAVIIMFGGANYFIQGHRSKVFKRIATEQIKQFDSKLVQIVSPLLVPPRNNVPRDLHNIIKSINNLTYINKTTLYLPDPVDNSAMWGYTAWREYREEDGFAKFFVAKEFEKAMVEALHGSDARMREINSRRDFIWYYLIKDQQGKPIAVLRLDGNPKENFREYVLGS